MFDTVVGAVLFTAGVAFTGAAGGLVGQHVQWAIQARQYEKRCLPKYGSITCIVDSSGLRIRNNDTDIHHGWPAFERWCETDDFILVFTGPADGYYLPKMSISAEDLAIVRRILDSQLAQLTSKR